MIAALRLPPARHTSQPSDGTQHKFGIPSPYLLNTLCNYVAYLAKAGLKHCINKTYILGISKFIGNPFANGALPRLEYVLTGIKRVESHAPQARSRLPITTDTMHKLRDVWLSAPEHPDHSGPQPVWDFSFSSGWRVHGPLCPGVLPGGAPTLAGLGIGQPLTALSGASLHQTEHNTPFPAGGGGVLGEDRFSCLPSYGHHTGVQPLTPGPLFIRQSRAPLTRSYLVSQLQAAHRIRGIDDTHFNGHSFRIGAATTAAK